MTFIELLIALAITAVTCSILAVLINATATGTNTQADGRRGLTRLQTIKSALVDEFVNTRAILAAGDNYVVYWIGDQPGAVVAPNYAVNFSELRLLEVDASGNLNIWAAKWPAGTSNATILANDSTYAFGSNWYAAATALKTNAYYNATVVATGVTSMTVSLDSATPTLAKMVNVCINLNDGVTSRQAVLGVTLVNPVVPW